MPKINAPIAFVYFVLSLPLVGFDGDFDSFVHSMEKEYGVKRTYIPFMGFANFMGKVIRPVGASDFKLAVFEHVNPVSRPSPERVDEAVVPQGWHPFIRVLSHKGGAGSNLCAAIASRSRTANHNFRSRRRSHDQDARERRTICEMGKQSGRDGPLQRTPAPGSIRDWAARNSGVLRGLRPSSFKIVGATSA